MDIEEFRVRGKEMVDYMCEYLTNINQKRVTPNVEPGYLRRLIPEHAPEQPESWEDIMRDVEDKIMPGVTHWQHPHFHAYFPSGNSFPSILGDMLSDVIGCIGFSWAASPACTELEMIVLDWLCRAFGLPTHFLGSGAGTSGGGVIQTSASECVLVCMLAARHAALRHLSNEQNGETPHLPHVDELRTCAHLLPRLVAYCSKEAHSCVEKAAAVCLVQLRILEPDTHGSLRGVTLHQAMEQDIRAGLLPFFVSATFGSTACTSFDALEELGEVCHSASPRVWLHVDAAYAGNALICPELRPLMRGIQYADSFNTNPNKWLLTNFDCSCMWVRDKYRLTEALVVDPLYLQHVWADEAIDYRHWGVPLSRRFRALKLWFVLRSYGIEGLREHIRRHVRLAELFTGLVKEDDRFEVTNEPRLGLVCFRLRRGAHMTKELLERLNSSGLVHMVPAMVRNHYSIRFCVTMERAVSDDIFKSWTIVRDCATELLEPVVRRRAPQLAHIKTSRFSLTRSVSNDVYARSTSRTSLYDGATPVLVPDNPFSFANATNEQEIEEFENTIPSDSTNCV